MITFDEVRLLCRRQEVDLVLASPPAPGVLCLRGQFDGYGDYFSVVASDVEYVQLAGTITVGDLMMDQMQKLAGAVPEWAALVELYSGPALAVRSADSADWQTASARELFLLVANHIALVPGKDWPGR